jgi:quercetin dioxygenase-like cupin family protein
MKAKRVKVVVVSLSLYCAVFVYGQTAKKPATPKQRSSISHSHANDSKIPTETPDQKPVFENEKLRVFRYELAPGVTINTGEHTMDHLLIPIGDVTVAIEARQRVRARSGEIQILKRGGKESVTNTGTSQAVAIDVELLGGLGFDDVICGINGVHCEDSVLGGDLKGGSWGLNIVAKTGLISIGITEIDPGVETDVLPRKFPQLRVWLTGGQVAEQAEDAESAPATDPAAGKLVENAPGDVVWISVGPPMAMKNIGAAQVKMVTMSFL